MHICCKWRKTSTGFNLPHEIPIETLFLSRLIFDDGRREKKSISFSSNVRLLIDIVFYAFIVYVFVFFSLFPVSLVRLLFLCPSTCAIAFRKPVTFIIFFNEHTKIKGKHTWTSLQVWWVFSFLSLVPFQFFRACFLFNWLLAVS